MKTIFSFFRSIDFLHYLCSSKEQYNETETDHLQYAVAQKGAF